MRILLLDDDISVTRAFARLLEMHGHAVSVVHTAAEACRRCGPGVFDLLLIDLYLPDTPGDVAVKQLRSACGPHVRTIGCSAMPREKLGSRVEAFDAFLPKPVSEDALLATIARLVPAPLAAERARQRT